MEFKFNKKYLEKKQVMKISLVIILVFSWLITIFSFFYVGVGDKQKIEKPYILLSKLNNSIDNSKYKYNYKEFEKIYLDLLMEEVIYQELSNDTLMKVDFYFGEKYVSVELEIDNKNFYYLYELV